MDERPVKAVLDPYNAAGSTRQVRFMTSKTVYKTDARCCHIDYVVCDSNWEAVFCPVAERHPRVRAYVKNHGLGLEVPYRLGGEARTYVPDFIVALDDGAGRGRPAALDRRESRATGVRMPGSRRRPWRPTGCRE